MTSFPIRRMLLGLASSILVVGCNSSNTPLYPNPDPQLRKKSTVLAADAAKRQPYKSDAPHGGDAPARAQVGYVLDRLEVVNLSNEQWDDVEVWVNEQYVIAIPSMKPNQLEQINFQMLFDDKGNHFPTDNKKVLIKSVELYKNGQMCSVPLQLAD